MESRTPTRPAPRPPEAGDADLSDSPSGGWRQLVRQLTGQKSVAPGVPVERRRAPDRRSHSIGSFLYGSFRPRRRRGRRLGDEQRTFLDWHEPRVLYLVLAILLMCCADALFTLNLLGAGAQELNIVMDALIGWEVRHFLAVKIGVTAAATIVLAMAARRHLLGVVPVIRLLQLFCAGYAVLMAYEVYLFWLFHGQLEQPWPAGWDLTLGPGH